MYCWWIRICGFGLLSMVEIAVMMLVRDLTYVRRALVPADAVDS